MFAIENARQEPRHPAGKTREVERFINRAAEIAFAAAGPLFWLAMVLAAVAASLGWRFLVF
jgi:hypothetical protein